jgi:aspartate aminotransferase-like enzyme
MIEERLSTGAFDALTLIHNETSCGVRNPLPAIADVMRKFPDVMFIVDTVSSFSTEPIPMDSLGIDVLLTGSQKALALPPGLALFSVSERASQRAQTIPGRGYYFDFMEFAKNQEQDMTPSTPVIPLIYALRSKLDEIAAEGIEARYERHRMLNAIVHGWVKKRGFDFFAQEGCRSLSLTCVKNTRGVNVAAWIARLRDRHHMVIDGGYGKLKGKTFRISNMGDETEETIRGLLEALDDTLEG